MRRVVAVAAAAVLVLLFAVPAAADPPEQRNFVAPLNGGEEVAAVDTNGTGVATFKLNTAGDALSFRLNVANIDEVTQAHIHCGAAGTNGPVVAFLFGLEPGGVTVNGTLAQGTITDAEVFPSAACGLADFDDLVEQMRTGNAYVNVHTLDHPGGEIRGQIK